MNLQIRILRHAEHSISTSLCVGDSSPHILSLESRNDLLDNFVRLIPQSCGTKGA
jgi:hypothetical protein